MGVEEELVWGGAEEPRLGREVGRKRTINSTSISSLSVWSPPERVRRVTGSGVWPGAAVRMQPDP